MNHDNDLDQTVTYKGVNGYIVGYDNEDDCLLFEAYEKQGKSQGFYKKQLAYRNFEGTLVEPLPKRHYKKLDTDEALRELDVTFEPNTTLLVFDSSEQEPRARVCIAKLNNGKNGFKYIARDDREKTHNPVAWWKYAIPYVDLQDTSKPLGSLALLEEFKNEFEEFLARRITDLSVLVKKLNDD